MSLSSYQPWRPERPRPPLPAGCRIERDAPTQRAVTRSGRPVVVVMAVEEYERLAGKVVTSLNPNHTADTE